MKKLLSFFLAITILMSLAMPAMAAEAVTTEVEALVDVVLDGAAPAAEQAVTSGKCGEDMTWSFNTEDGTLTISGTGSMYAITNNWEDFGKGVYGYEPEWWSLPVRHVVVNEGVEYLSDYAFAQSAKGNEALLETVELPTSLKEIPQYGFIISTAMTSLEIPEGIKSVTGWPFGNPNVSFLTLNELILPSTLEKMDILTVYYAGFNLAANSPTLQKICFAGTRAQWGQIERDAAGHMAGLMTITDAQYTTFETNTFNTFNVICSDDEPVINFDDLLFANSVDRIEATDVTYFDGETPKYPVFTVYYKDGTSSAVPEGVNVSYLSAMPTVAGTYDLVANIAKHQVSFKVTVQHKLVQYGAQEPTCSAVGWNAYEACEYCDYTTYVEIPTTSHNYTTTVVKPTATSEGYTLYTCTCGHSYKDNFVPKLSLTAPTVSIKLDATSGKPVLTWNAIDDAASYYVYRSTEKSGTYTKVVTAKATTWTDTSAAVGTKYYYKVKAIGSDRNSGYSNLVAQTPKCAVPTITVTIKSDKPYISWAKVSGAAKYAVYYSTSKTGTYKKLVTTTKTYYAHSDSATGSQCFYKVVAVASNTSYNSGYSSIKSCNVPCLKPAVTVTNDAATGKPVLTWKAVTGAKKYEVYRSLSGKNAYTKIKTVTGKTYTDTGAAVNKKYDYQVKAIGSATALNSAMSTKKTIMCKVAAPVISVKINADGKPVVSWKAVSGAKSYVVYRSTSATKNYKKYTGGKLDVKKCTFTDTAVTAGKTYYYKVVAVGTSNESAYSNYKKATGTCATPSVTVKLTSNKPVLKWAKVTGAKKYEIQYSTDGKTFKKLTTTTSTSYTHKAKKGTYYYKVKALGSATAYNSALSAATKAVKVK